MKRIARSIWPYLLVGALILARNSTALLRAEFWAEDADEFFFTALSGGIESLWTPVYGYHFFLSRVIAYVTTFFPVLWAPFIFAGVALVLNAVVTGYFSKDSFSWLIPSRWQRVLVCCILAIGPGSGEVVMNIVNLATPLTCLALLLLIEKPFSITWPRFTAIVFLLLSAGQVFLLAPLIAYSWYVSRDRKYLWLLASFIPVVLLNAFGTVTVGQKTGLLSLGGIYRIPRLLVEHSFNRIFLGPFFGPRLGGEIQKLHDLIYWPMVIGVCWAGYRYLKPRLASFDRKKLWLMVWAYLSTIASFGVIAVSRSYASWQIHRKSGMALWDMRYSYMPGAVALLIWFAVFFYLARQSDRRRKWLGIAGVLLISAYNVAEWRAVYPRPNLNWASSAEGIQKALELRSQGALSPDQQDQIVHFQAHPSYYHAAQMSIVFRPHGLVLLRGKEALRQ